MLTKETIVSKIEYLAESGMIQVQEATIVKDGGKEITRAFHRFVADPADVTPEQLSDHRVKAVAQAVWTNDVVEARKAERAKASKKG